MQEEINAWRNLFLSIVESKLEIKCYIKGGGPLAIHVLSLLSPDCFQQVLFLELFKDWDFTITLLDTSLLNSLIPNCFVLDGTTIKMLRYKSAAKHPKTKDFIFEASIFNKKNIITNYADMEIPLSLFYIEFDMTDNINNFFNMLIEFYSTPQSVSIIINYLNMMITKHLTANNGFFEQSINNIDFGKLKNYENYFTSLTLIPSQIQFIVSNYNQLDRLLVRLPMKLLPKSNKIKNLLISNDVNLPHWLLDASYINKTIVTFNDHLYNSFFKTSYDKLLSLLKELLEKPIDSKILHNEIKTTTIKLNKLLPTYINYEMCFNIK